MVTEPKPLPDPIPLKDGQVTEAILGTPVGAPKMSNVVEHLVAMAGGERGLARRIWREFNSKKCTPATRQRIIEVMLDGIKFHERQNPNDVSLALATNDDLQEALENALAKLKDKK